MPASLVRPAKQLMVVRKRTQPAAVYVARLTATATFAYLIALLVPDGTARPVLAPLTALLVLQASLFQTIRSAMRKVVAVTAGVLVAVTVSAFVGFSWWLLALLIAGALTLGYLLRLGDDLLEVPISAMLIFASAGEHAAASGRVVDTLVGSAAGLAGGLAFAPLRVQS
ncbi:FUSC family protein, partial [Trebonia sp.]